MNMYVNDNIWIGKGIERPQDTSTQEPASIKIDLSFSLWHSALTTSCNLQTKTYPRLIQTLGPVQDVTEPPTEELTDITTENNESETSGPVQDVTSTEQTTEELSEITTENNVPEVSLKTDVGMNQCSDGD